MATNNQGEEIFCRLCLKPSTHYSPLFEDNVVDMLESLTSIKISHDDAGPNLTCFKCLVEMKCAYKTQQRLIKTEMHLREKMLSKVTIKEELEENCSDSAPLENIVKCEIIENAEHEESNFVDNKDQSFYKCRVCLNEYDNLVDYGEHMQNHEPKQCFMSPNIVFASEIKKDTQTQNELEDSDSDSDKKQGFFRCRTCLEVYDRFSDYIAHIKIHEKRKCLMCPKVISAYDLTEHNRTHESGFCEYCGAQLTNSHCLRKHVRLQHGEAKFMCELCGDISKNKQAFDLHMSKRHTKDPAFMCDHCGAKYFRLPHLNKHIKMKHSEKTFKCKVCTATFADEFRLKVHTLKHSEEKLFICEFCGKGFKFKCNMNTHKSVHGWKSDGKFDCRVCGQGFPTKFSLSMHVARRHDK